MAQDSLGDNGRQRETTGGLRILVKIIHPPGLKESLGDNGRQRETTGALRICGKITHPLGLKALYRTLQRESCLGNFSYCFNQ